MLQVSLLIAIMPPKRKDGLPALAPEESLESMTGIEDALSQSDATPQSKRKRKATEPPSDFGPLTRSAALASLDTTLTAAPGGASAGLTGASLFTLSSLPRPNAFSAQLQAPTVAGPALVNLEQMAPFVSLRADLAAHKDAYAQRLLDDGQTMQGLQDQIAAVDTRFSALVKSALDGLDVNSLLGDLDIEQCGPLKDMYRAIVALQRDRDSAKFDLTALVGRLETIEKKMGASSEVDEKTARDVAELSVSVHRMEGVLSVLPKTAAPSFVTPPAVAFSGPSTQVDMAPAAGNVSGNLPPLSGEGGYGARNAAQYTPLREQASRPHHLHVNAFPVTVGPLRGENCYTFTERAAGIIDGLDWARDVVLPVVPAARRDHALIHFRSLPSARTFIAGINSRQKGNFLDMVAEQKAGCTSLDSTRTIAMDCIHVADRVDVVQDSMNDDGLGGDTEVRRTLLLDYRIISWNVGGRIDVKIRTAAFKSLIESCDVMVCQETWLAPGDEDSLPLPDGYDAYACSRPSGSTTAAAAGGVLLIYRAGVVTAFLENVCRPDVVVCDLGEDWTLIGAYLCPASSYWMDKAEVDPLTASEEALQYCAARDSQRRVVWACDANGRTKDEQAAGGPGRLSEDVKPSNARGNWLIQMAERFGLFIANGTVLEADSPGRYTSVQRLGSSVIDYVLISCAASDSLGHGSLSILPVEGAKDHRALTFILPAGISLKSLTPPPRNPVPLPSTIPSVQSVEVHLQALRPTWFKDNVEIDRLTREAVRRAQRGQDALIRLYGPMCDSRQPHVAYISSFAKQLPSGVMQSAFAVALGGSMDALRGGVIPPIVGGSRLSALLVAVSWVLATSPVAQPVVIYTMSLPLVRLVCVDMARKAELDFPGLDGEAARRFVAVVQARSTAVELRMCSRERSLSIFASLKDAAQGYWYRNILAEGCPPLMPSPSMDAQISTLPKVSTTVGAAVLGLASQRGVRRGLVDGRAGSGSLDSRRSTFQVRRLQAVNLQRLTEASTPRDWWATVKEFTRAKKRPSRVSIAALLQSFHTRLNPTPVVPDHFDAVWMGVVNGMAADIPASTVDRTAQQFFSRRVTPKEVASVKKRIAHRRRSARGDDRGAYMKIMDIPNDVLADLFNACIDSGTAPTMWLTTVLIGILKPKKRAEDPESYRLVGLESCLLKVFTLIIEQRITEWAETEAVFPQSQNGFRRGRRTHNNPFILRCAIEKARKQGKKLYVVFVDLKNAFPATDLPTLWLKLFNAGVSGPLFDWLRMLYAHMRYVVHHEGAVSEAFKSLIGVLTGDSASPILWNLYFADIDGAIPVHVDDLMFGQTGICHVEHADDVAMFSTGWRALQEKITAFYEWCRRNFMTMSLLKTEWMVFGGSPAKTVCLTANGVPLMLVDVYKFIGVIFMSGKGDTFRRHYRNKAAKAKAVAAVSVSLSNHVGALPPVDGIRIYMSCIDPHLTFGAEVVLDTAITHRKKLENVQTYFLRRLLGLSHHVPTFALFLETGVMPIMFRRVLMAIRHLRVALALPQDEYTYLALADSASNSGHGSAKAGWFAGLKVVLEALPVPVMLPVWSLGEVSAAGWCRALEKRVREASSEWVSSQAQTSIKCVLLQKRLRLPKVKGASRSGLQPYLLLGVATHRVAFTKLMFSDYPLAYEVLRRRTRYRPDGVPREWRLCRFCEEEVETVGHVCFGCEHDERLMALREKLLEDVWAFHPRLRDRVRRLGVMDNDLLSTLALESSFGRRFGRFLSDVFSYVDEYHMYSPPSDI